jgi:N-ethylmaleimide reductase
MKLFTPLRLGALTLPNRIIMAPLARARSDEHRAPTAMVAEYYAQRADAGLIISEASSVGPLSVSRPHASAMFLDRHVEGFRRVAAAVHAKGGRIFQQLYHLGRKSDPSRMPDGAQPVAPSAVAAQGKIAGLNGQIDFAMPRPLDLDEIPGVVDEFRAAARNAQRAGMDGVEIHGANGYLIDQFLRDGANRRTDAYGGAPENRIRFLLQVVDAVIGVFGAGRVGVRLSPHFRVDGSMESDPVSLYGVAATALNNRQVAYLHIVESMKPDTPQSPPPGGAPVLAAVRRAFSGPLIVNGAYDRDLAEAAIASGAADAVAFGALYIANPDLVERFRRGGPYNPPDVSTFHNGGAKGYIDYPALDAVAASASA